MFEMASGERERAEPVDRLCSKEIKTHSFPVCNLQAKRGTRNVSFNSSLEVGVSVRLTGKPMGSATVRAGRPSRQKGVALGPALP